MSLGNRNDTRAVEPLVQALGDEYNYVRSGAAEALGKLNDTRAIGPLLSVSIDDDAGVRKAAKDALIKLGYIETVAAKEDVAVGETVVPVN